MVVTNSPDVFQREINYLFRGFEFIRSYIHYLLILTKLFWTDHVHKLELNLNKLN